MNGWLEDLRVAARAFGQKPGFALLTILILALGSGATTVIFTVISGVLLKPLEYPEPQNLVTLHVQSDKYGDSWGFSYPDFLDCQRECRSFEAVAGWTYRGGTVSGPGEPEYVAGRQISSQLFSVLRIQPVKGRSFLATEDQVGAAPVAVISTRLWRQRYGASPGTIGMPLTYDGKTYTIVGIAPAGFRLDGEPDVFTPLGQATEPRMHWRAARFMHVVARLRRGTTLDQVRTELGVLSERLAKQYPDSDADISEVPHRLHNELVQDVRPTLWLLLSAVSIVLLIGCVNVASMFLTRVVSRQREFAVRLALGAPRGRLLRQCLTESGVLGISGGLLGLLLAIVATDPFLRFWPERLPRSQEVHVDWRVLLFAITSSIATGLLFGFVPAIRANHSAIEEALRSQSRTIAGSVRRPLSGFVMCQIGLALVLLSAAGVLVRTLARFSSLNPGIDISNVLSARVAVSPASLNNAQKARAAWKDLAESLRQVPGVQSVALTDIVPMRQGQNLLPYSPSVSLAPVNQAPEALASAVSPDYLKVMRLPLVRGRFIDENDRLGSNPVVVIDENLARHAFPGENALGKQLWTYDALGSRPIQVVGVVGHVRHWGLATDDLSAVQDQLYYPLAQVPDNLVRFFSSVLSVVVRTDVPALNIVEALRRQARSATGDQALYEIATMEQLASSSLARQRFLLLLFAIFSGFALLLAAVGLYSVITYITSERIPEFGVRITLGANRADLIRLVLRESLPVIVAGISFGLLAAMASTRVLERLVTVARVPMISIFAVIVPVLVAVTLSAGYIPARRAARVDPVVALRYE